MTTSDKDYEFFQDQSPVRKRRSDSAEPSCVSTKSDQSKDFPMQFREGESSESCLLQRSDSPEPSCVSMKSDQSKDFPMQFREGESSESWQRKTHGLPQKERSDSAEPSCVSMKTDQSKDFPMQFREGESTESCLLQKERSDSAEPSCVSMKTDQSKDFPMQFRKADSYPEASVEQSQAAHSDEFHSDVKEQEHQVIFSPELTSVYQQRFKSKMQEKFQTINEEISKPGTSTLLNMIYTELYITEGESGEMNDEHEVRQIEATSIRAATEDTPIKCNDIFKPQSGDDNLFRTVLTKGIAGIGKTVLVQKFILDWAEGKANQDVHFIFPLPFRELNLMKGKNLSLIDLLCHFFTDIKGLKPEEYHQHKVMFIFDGLDECRLPIDFQNNASICDVTESASVDVLFTSLIKGSLLPSALLWITSRPAAANQIPPECVDQVTEVRGFSDPQKEEYFRKRISDQTLSNKIISHIKSSRSLYIMCHMPVFCWISATVLERMLGEAEGGEIPKTLTQMFTHFLIYQTKQRRQKFPKRSVSDSDQINKCIHALGKLAFQQLDKGNLIFYEEDLRECGIDVKEASVYSGICTQIFIEEFALHQRKVYSFVHLTVQEHLAALHAFLSFINRSVSGQQTLGFLCFSEKTTMFDFLKSAVDNALQSENGHLDLFLRFLLGLSVESSQTALQSLLTQKKSHSNEEIITYIKEKIKGDLVPEKSINLFHCLNELNDHSLVQEVQAFLSRRKSHRLHRVNLSPAQWSALVFVILNSAKELEEFDLWCYEPTEECLLKLMPVVKASRIASLCECKLTEKSCAALAPILSSKSSCLRELDMSNNNLQDSGVKMLSAGLESPHCKLEILRLGECNLTEESCAVLTSALISNPSYLRELRLTRNKLQDSGVKLLSAALKNPKCKLEKLRLNYCNITEEGCVALSSALKSNPSHLKYLDMGRNKLGPSGVKQLSDLLADSKVQILKLFDCCITEESYACLISALKSNPSHLRELDLGWNNPGKLGVKQLSELLTVSQCRLEILKLHDSNITDEDCAALTAGLKLNPSNLTELDLTNNKIGDSGLKLLSALVEDKTFKLQKVNIYSQQTTRLEKNKESKSRSEVVRTPTGTPQSRLCECNLTERSCAALASVLNSKFSCLGELDMSKNNLQDSGVKIPSAGLTSPHCKLEVLRLGEYSHSKVWILKLFDCYPQCKLEILKLHEITTLQRKAVLLWLQWRIKHSNYRKSKATLNSPREI
ncbi:hypothetical protein SRHO_G00076780 [Serrasalmus rhombeus]